MIAALDIEEEKQSKWWDKIKVYNLIYFLGKIDFDDGGT